MHPQSSEHKVKVVDLTASHPPETKRVKSLDLSTIPVNLRIELIKELAGKILKVLNGRALTPDNVISVSIEVMRHVQAIKKLSGVEKKEYVIAAFKYFIDEHTDLSGINRELMLTAIDHVLRGAIDAIVQASKKASAFLEKKIKGCCGCLSSSSDLD